MLKVTSLKLPVFAIEIDTPKTTLLIRTPTKHDYYEILQGNKEAVEPYLLTEMPPFTESTFTAFIGEFARQMKQYRQDNMDYLAIPERETFGKDECEDIKLPIITSADHLVYKHTGLDFAAQLELPITEYWLLLADAIKQRMLQRTDGAEYLNDCYNSMHKVSTLTPKIRK